jgi:hypothetical protein
MKKPIMPPTIEEQHPAIRLAVRDILLADRADPGKAREHREQISTKYGLNPVTVRRRISAIRALDLTDEAIALNVRVERVHHVQTNKEPRGNALLTPIIECPLIIESTDSTHLSPRVRTLLATFINNPNSDVLNAITEELKYV